MSGISADPIYIWDPTHTEKVNAWDVLNYNNPNQNADYLRQASAAILSSGSFWDTPMGRDIGAVDWYSSLNTASIGLSGMGYIDNVISAEMLRRTQITTGVLSISKYGWLASGSKLIGGASSYIGAPLSVGLDIYI